MKKYIGDTIIFHRPSKKIKWIESGFQWIYAEANGNLVKESKKDWRKINGFALSSGRTVVLIQFRRKILGVK